MEFRWREVRGMDRYTDELLHDTKQTIDEIMKAREQCRRTGALAVAALIISGIALIIRLL